MAIVYVGLGSNLGDKEANVLQAVHEMRAFARVLKISTLIETPAETIDGDPAPDQPGFVNGMVELDTDFSPQEVLQELLRIEEDMGRVRSTKGAPREIDLDIVAYGNEMLNEDALHIPHPKMTQRSFVLGPLAELNAKWTHPETGQTVQELLSQCPAK